MKNVVLIIERENGAKEEVLNPDEAFFMAICQEEPRIVSVKRKES